jgi:hypothetical protein
VQWKGHSKLGPEKISVATFSSYVGNKRNSPLIYYTYRVTIAQLPNEAVSPGKFYWTSMLMNAPVGQAHQRQL